jgi:hypothetical protein
MRSGTRGALVFGTRILRVLLDTPEEHRTRALAFACRVYCNHEDWSELERRHAARLEEERLAR